MNQSTTKGKSSIYTLQFWLLCTSSFLFFASFNMIVPELYEHLTGLGGADYEGWIIALFTLTAGLSRPFSGKFADTLGRIPVMIIGTLVCFALGFLYPWATTVVGFFVLRFFHGFSTGFKPTGTTAYVADLVPTNKRGEAMGILGISGSMGMGAGNAISSPIKLAFSMDTLFYTSAFAALCSILILVRMKETLPQKKAFQWSLLKLSSDEIFEPRVIAPATVMFLTYFSFGVVLTVIPDFSVYLGIENKGLFHVFFIMASLLMRLIGGKASDKYGRVIVLKVSTFFLSIVMVMMGFVSSQETLIAMAVLFGLATGMNSPSIFAWTIDRSLEAHRGRAMATVFITMEAGIGLGALYGAWAYGNVTDRFPYAFWGAALMSLIAFLFLILRPKRHSVAKLA